MLKSILTIAISSLLIQETSSVIATTRSDNPNGIDYYSYYSYDTTRGHTIRGNTTLRHTTRGDTTQHVDTTRGDTTHRDTTNGDTTRDDQHQTTHDDSDATTLVDDTILRTTEDDSTSVGTISIANIAIIGFCCFLSSI